MLLGFIRNVLWVAKYELTRNYGENYLDRVELKEESIHPRLYTEARMAGALYCKRLHANKVIVISGTFDGNGRSYRMLIPDCAGDVQWGCFFNGPERTTLNAAECVDNQPVYADIPNIGR